MFWLQNIGLSELFLVYSIVQNRKNVLYYASVVVKYEASMTNFMCFLFNRSLFWCCAAGTVHGSAVSSPLTLPWSLCSLLECVVLNECYNLEVNSFKEDL